MPWFISMWPFGLLYQSLFGGCMKSVTIDTVRERIAELNCLSGDGVLSLRGEFELACLRQLVALMQPAQVAEKPDLHKVIYHFRDWNEGFPVERFKADYVISWMLANYPPAPIAPVAGVDDDVRNVVALLENNEWAEHCTKTVLGSMLEAEVTRLVGRAQPVPVAAPDAATAIRACIDEFPWAVRDIVEECATIAENACRAAMPHQAQQPATDNTAQQFEALATSNGGSKS